MAIKQEVLQYATELIPPRLNELIERLCFNNAKQWELEDKIREPSLTDKQIAFLKKEIDSSNLERFYLINQIDSYFLITEVKPIRRNISKPYCNSESLGQLLDRISILKLRGHCIQDLIKSSASSGNSEEQKSLIKTVLALKHQYGFSKGIFLEFRRRLRAGTAVMETHPQIKIYYKRLLK